MKHSEEKILIDILYLDDLIYNGNNAHMFEGFKESMKRKFFMTNLGKMRYFLRVEVKQKNAGIFIHQQKYVKKILIRFGMYQCNKMCNPIVLECRLTKDRHGKHVDATNYK